jgi:hypothetical protein
MFSLSVVPEMRGRGEGGRRRGEEKAEGGEGREEREEGRGEERGREGERRKKPFKIFVGNYNFEGLSAMLPATLMYLRLDNKFNGKLEFFPPSLTKLIIGPDYKQYVNFL